jgi:hypothetical protein
LPVIVRVGACDAERTKSARGETRDCCLHGGLNGGGIFRHREDHLRSALCDAKLLPVGSFDRGFGALVHGIERREMHDVKGLQDVCILDAADHGEIDRILILGARC